MCATKKRRQEMGDALAEKIATKTHNDSKSPLLFRTPLIGKASAKYMVNVSDELYSAQRRWQAREISNVSISLKRSLAETNKAQVHLSQHFEPIFRENTTGCDTVSCVPYVLTL